MAIRTQKSTLNSIVDMLLVASVCTDGAFPCYTFPMPKEGQVCHSFLWGIVAKDEKFPNRQKQANAAEAWCNNFTTEEFFSSHNFIKKVNFCR